MWIVYILGYQYGHYRLVSWAQKRFKLPITRLFLHSLVLDNIKHTTKSLHHWPFVRVIHSDRWIPRTKGSVLRKVFTYNDINMVRHCCITHRRNPWWRYQMETSSALLAMCAGNSPVTGEFPTLRPVTRSFDVLFDLRLNKRLSKQWRGWWFGSPSLPLWRHCNATYRWLKT